MRAFVFLTPLLVVACTARPTNKDEAQAQFVKAFSCPKERTTATDRPDLNAYDLNFGPSPAPPADVAADPGRLAEWKKQEQKLREGYNNSAIVQVRGCDHETYYSCGIGTTGMGEQVIACPTVQHPPPTSK